MAVMAAIAWIWSGVLTTTASRLFSFSSMTRKSWYRLASGNFLNAFAALLSSTSHKATMFSVLKLLRFSTPRPPAAMMPSLSFSFGEMRPVADLEQEGSKRHKALAIEIIMNWHRERKELD